MTRRQGWNARVEEAKQQPSTAKGKGREQREAVKHSVFFYTLPGEARRRRLGQGILVKQMHHTWLGRKRRMVI